MSFFSWLKEEWVALRTVFSGKTIAFIGPMSSGKTVWLSYLYTGNFSDKNRPTKRKTSISRPTKEARDLIDQFGILLTKTEDVSGNIKTQQDRWENVIQKADYVVYLIDSSKILNTSSDRAEYLSHIEDHRRVIKKSTNSAKLFGIVATHPDLVQGHDKLNDYSNSDIYDSLFSVKELRDLEVHCNSKFRLVVRLDEPDLMEDASKKLFTEIKQAING